MARVITIDNNQVISSGYILLVRPIEIKGKVYNKVWCPFWDISLNKNMYDKPKNEREKAKNWVWHGIDNDKVIFHITGDKVMNFVEVPTPPKEKICFCYQKERKKRK